MVPVVFGSEMNGLSFIFLRNQKLLYRNRVKNDTSISPHPDLTTVIHFAVFASGGVFCFVIIMILLIFRLAK